jgi:gamma-glutamylcyclotransferase (GGCT)/AIG2-like uncharacterized protein YtfP
MRFFFYGTLQAGSANPVAAAIHGKLVSEGPAALSGSLFAIPDATGWFPALVEGPGTVHGQVYGAGPDFTSDDLAAMDRYEDFDPARPAQSLYLRIVMPLADGTAVQVYRFNQPLPSGSRPIPQGAFKAWLAAAGVAEFSGRHDA